MSDAIGIVFCWINSKSVLLLSILVLLQVVPTDAFGSMARTENQTLGFWLGSGPKFSGDQIECDHNAIISPNMTIVVFIVLRNKLITRDRSLACNRTYC